MRIFYKEGDWLSKVNFVDENNVLLGYDNEDDCCADGGWFLSDDRSRWEEETFKEKSMDLPGWVFDKEYFREIEPPGEYEKGGAVQFRITDGTHEKFLTLYNHHNGYYSRGFKFTHGEEKIRDGCV